MTEQRLIDANALLDKQESLYMKGHVLFHGVTAYAIESAPTIDPETLPIVRELRAKISSLNAGIENLSYVAKKAYEQRDDIKNELERVTAERDAAVKDIEQAITIYRDVEGWDILCRFCKGESCQNGGDCEPEWHGDREVTNNE